MTKIIKIHFSPSETTKKVVEQVAENFDFESEAYDLLNFDSKKNFQVKTLPSLECPFLQEEFQKRPCKIRKTKRRQYKSDSHCKLWECSCD